MRFRFESSTKYEDLPTIQESMSPKEFCKQLSYYMFGKNKPTCTFEVTNCPKDARFSTSSGAVIVKQLYGKKFKKNKTLTPEKPRRQKRWVSRSPERGL
jgi:hypothetical protein